MQCSLRLRRPSATPSRMGLTPGVLFDMSRSCRDLDVQVDAERLCEYLRTERPVLLVGSPKRRAFMDSQSMDRRDPKFSKTLEAGLSHLKSLMEIYHWQSEQGRWFLHEDPAPSGLRRLSNRWCQGTGLGITDTMAPVPLKASTAPQSAVLAL